MDDKTEMRRLGTAPEIEDMKAADQEEEDMVDEAVEILLKAEKIRMDSKLMEKVMPRIEQTKQAAEKVTSIADLRKLAQKKKMEDM